MKVLDLFCGVGGLSYGLEEAGFDVVAGVDHDEDVIETFNENHSARGIVADLKNTTPEDFDEEYNIGDVDSVSGGPPCQGFSNANMNNGDDERNNLIFTFADYVEYFDPDYFLMENVVGILSDSRYEDLLQRFEDMGYDVAYENMLATEYGIPQKRRRVITVGSRDISKEILDHVSTKDSPTVKDAIGDLPVLEVGEDSDMNAHTAPNHRSDTVEKIKRVPQGGDMGDLPEEYQLKSYDPERHSCCYGRLEWDEPADTITTGFLRNGSGRFTHPEQHRALTPREAARLQSFPDSFKFSEDIYQASKEIGNAVPPELARRIGNSIQIQDSITTAVQNQGIAD